MPHESKLIALIAVGFVLAARVWFSRGPRAVAATGGVPGRRHRDLDYALRSLGVTEERSKLVTQWLRTQEISRPK